MRTLDLATLENQRITWQIAHEALSRLARERAAADAEEGRWLLAAERAAVHVHLGYGCFSEYIERMFGYRPRSLQEKLRVAEALEGLPACARALSNGELSWSAVRELTRVALRETEQSGSSLRAARRSGNWNKSWQVSARGIRLPHRRTFPRSAMCCASRWPPRRSHCFAMP